MINTKGSVIKDKSSILLSQFIAGTEQNPPEAIHMDSNKINPIKIDFRQDHKQKILHNFERPMSALVSDIPFDQRKFSVDSLKSKELVYSK